MVLAGCSHSRTATVTQPNPLHHPSYHALRESIPATIVTGDMELEIPRAHRRADGRVYFATAKLPLHNIAQFTVVSRDRLRFHVQLEHKWREWADVTTWSAHLVDDQGRIYRPEEVDLHSDTHIPIMWDFQPQRPTVLGSLSLFRGKGDVAFYARDLFTSDVRSLTLVLERGQTSYNFRWRFSEDGDGPGSGPGAGASGGATALWEPS